MCFIDSSSKSIGETHDPDIHKSINNSFSSAQQMKLAALINLIRSIHKTLNFVSDYDYVVGIFPAVGSFSHTL